MENSMQNNGVIIQQAFMPAIPAYDPWCVYQGDFVHKMGTQDECINWMTHELGFGMTTAAAIAQGYSIERYRGQRGVA